MKYTTKPILIIIILLSFIVFNGFLGALELEFSGGVNLLTFDPDIGVKIPVYSNPASSSTLFEPFWFPFGTIELRDEVTEAISYNVRISRDNILRNSLEYIIYARTNHFSFEFGPFLGIIDKLELPFLGMYFSIEFSHPGVVFIQFSASGTFGTQFDFTSDHERETIGGKIGFWLPSLIPSFTASIKTFKQIITPDYYIHDNLTRFQGSLEFYLKNFPIVIRADAGYQIYSRTSEDLFNTFTDKFSSLFAGFELAWQINNKINLKFGAEIPFMLTAAASSSVTIPPFYTMPKANIGFVYTFR